MDVHNKKYARKTKKYRKMKIKCENKPKTKKAKYVSKIWHFQK